MTRVVKVDCLMVEGYEDEWEEDQRSSMRGGERVQSSWDVCCVFIYNNQLPTAFPPCSSILSRGNSHRDVISLRVSADTKHNNNLARITQALLVGQVKRILALGRGDEAMRTWSDLS